MADFEPLPDEPGLEFERLRLDFIHSEIDTVRTFLGVAQTELKIGNWVRVEDLLTQCRKAIDTAMQRVDELDASAQAQEIQEQLNSLTIEVEAMHEKLGLRRRNPD